MSNHTPAVYVIHSPILRKNTYKIGYSTQGIRGLRERYGTEYGEVLFKYYRE